MTTGESQLHEAADAMERVAAELTAELAMAQAHATPLPAALAASIIRDGERDLGVASRVVPLVPRERAWTSRLGWMLAAAAAVAWLVVPSPWARRDSVASRSAPSLLRDSLATSADALRLSWGPSNDPAGASATGDLLWDPATQRGVMRFAGLVPNDPRTAQYQLWIIDAERDARYPVDGGVFDVASSGEVLVPIRARLRVSRPTLFAVTLERPGGVVVSSRERLVLAAATEG